MRTPIVAGNWKMNQTIAETRQLIVEMVNGLNGITGVQVVICPPHTALLVASALLEGSNIELGAQNMHWDKVGAFTGEVSPIMIAEICNYVIIGHSERRTYFGETDTIVNKKVKSALENHLNTFLCVGESIEQREAGQTSKVISDLLKSGLNGVQVEQADSLIISYEPVWAIGTGMAAAPEYAEHVIRNIIRPELTRLFGDETTQRIRTLYGGSVTGDNAINYFNQPNIDGAFVGGASLKPQEFVEIVKAACVNSR